MAYSDAHALERCQRGFEGLGNHYRAVTATGAPDRDRQVRLPFPYVLGHEKGQQICRLFEKLTGQRLLPEERDNRAIAPGLGLQCRHEVWVWQEPHVEHDICVYRQPELEPETQERDDEPLRLIAGPGEGLELLAELMHRKVCRI